MYYLVAAIILNVFISVAFKLFPRYGIDTFQAIVVNYVVCVVTGCLYIGEVPLYSIDAHAKWFQWALLMGSGFVGVFYLLALSTKVAGITSTTIANKLSLVIPALFSVLLYHELVGTGKVIGILLAFPAIYLSTRLPGEPGRSRKLLLPALIFIGGGLLDTGTKYIQANYLPDAALQARYTIFCFAMAGCTGLAILLVMLALKKTRIHGRSIVAGTIVGIPNYFSIYYFIRMLHSGILQSSASIPVLNIGIVVVASVTAMLAFREPASRVRLLGILLAIVAILLIAFGDK